MHALYLLSVWIHILAATVWIGGMSFLVLVVVPWLRRGGRVEAAVFLRETGERFRNVGSLLEGAAQPVLRELLAHSRTHPSSSRRPRGRGSSA